jgi:hypothetical protein
MYTGALDQDEITEILRRLGMEEASVPVASMALSATNQMFSFSLTSSLPATRFGFVQLL